LILAAMATLVFSLVLKVLVTIAVFGAIPVAAYIFYKLFR
jgi:hypothetical protein